MMCSADSSDQEAQVCPDSQDRFSSPAPTAHRHCIIVDSGATFHATSDLGVLSLDADKQSARDRGAAGGCAGFHRRDGMVLPVAAGVGTIEACEKNFRLPGVRYVPQLDPAGVTLVSVQQLAASGFLVMFCGAFCYVSDADNGGSIVGKGRLCEDDGFYHLDLLRVPEYAEAA